MTDHLTLLRCYETRVSLSFGLWRFIGELTFCSMVRGITALCAMFEEGLVLGPVRVVVAHTARWEGGARAEDRHFAVVVARQRRI